MKKYLFAPFVALALVFAMPTQAAKQSLDELLSGIKADIAAKRLSTPVGNNALAKIQQYRQQAPYDFRVTPLVYQWGEAYVALANNAIAQKDYAKAQGYLDIVWPVAALTPGLEAAQASIDKAGGVQVAPQPAKPAGPTPAEIERQRQVAAAAAAERARIEADRKKQQAEAQRQQELAKKQAEEELAKRQEQERARRAAVAAAAKQEASTIAVAPVVAAPVIAAAITSKEVEQIWAEAEEESAPIASYPIDAKLLVERDRDGMQKALAPICKAILDNDASVVVHSKSTADYRWLTVRLTLCMRYEDSSFRLRYSHKNDAKDGEPYISLHPARDVSLIKQASE